MRRSCSAGPLDGQNSKSDRQRSGCWRSWEAGAVDRRRSRAMGQESGQPAAAAARRLARAGPVPPGDSAGLSGGGGCPGREPRGRPPRRDRAGGGVRLPWLGRAEWRRRLAGRGDVDRAGVAVAGGGPHAAVAVQGHTGGVWSVALSADGRLVASGGGDGDGAAVGDPTGRLLRRCRAIPAGSGAWRCPATVGCWPAAARTGRSGCGTRHRAARGHAAGPHRRGLERGAVRRRPAAGQRR